MMASQVVALAAIFFGSNESAMAATCSYAETGGPLGTASSFDIRSTAQTGTGTFTATCGSGGISLLSTDSALKATLTSDNIFLLRNIDDSTKTIAYQARGSNGETYTSGFLVIDLLGLNILTALPNRKASVVLQLATVATMANNVPKGTYRDTLRLTWDYKLCDGLGLLFACVGTVYTGVAIRTITVELQVTNDCVINPGAINFGSAALPVGFGEAASQMTLVCTSGMEYTVGLSAGSNPNAGRRQMASGTNRLAYDIFFGSSSTPWGTNAGSRVPSSQATSGPAAGIANGVTGHVFPYRARIYTDQPAPPPGTYKDSVTVDVQF